MSNFYKVKCGEGVPGPPLSWLQRCGLKSGKMVKIWNCWYKSARKVYIPLSDFFYQIWHGEGVPGLHTSTKFHRSGFKNAGLQPPKTTKLLIFSINLTKGDTPLSDFFLQNLVRGSESQVRTLTPNFTVMLLKRWAKGPRIRQKY